MALLAIYMLKVLASSVVLQRYDDECSSDVPAAVVLLCSVGQPRHGAPAQSGSRMLFTHCTLGMLLVTCGYQTVQSSASTNEVRKK